MNEHFVKPNQRLYFSLSRSLFWLGSARLGSVWLERWLLEPLAYRASSFTCPNPAMTKDGLGQQACLPGAVAVDVVVVVVQGAV